jgi:hypothetical protein
MTVAPNLYKDRLKQTYNLLFMTVIQTCMDVLHSLSRRSIGERVIIAVSKIRDCTMFHKDHTDLDHSNSIE